MHFRAAAPARPNKKKNAKTRWIEKKQKNLLSQ